ncbi:phosphoglycerate dehydrogenase [Cohnella terricola]|nr:phosphoglycerate dehydrogenase [Cohnella terricola]
MPNVVITPRSYGVYSPDIWKDWKDAGFEVIAEPGPLPEERLAELLAEADALLVGTDVVSRHVLERSPTLKVIAKYGVGVDNIAVDYAKERGISVFNTPGVNTEAVADYAFGLILSLARNIPGSHADLMDGKWKKAVGREIWSKTIGILGLGSIGKALARRAKGFNMQVLAYDLYPDHKFANEHGVMFADFETVIRSSDVISVHLALTPDTRHLIGAKELEWMKEETLLINTARGGIVDEDALFEALSRNRIAGAALDVFQVEPPIASPLRKLNNVILTPHNASASVEAIKRMTEQSTEQIMRFYSHK